MLWARLFLSLCCLVFVSQAQAIGNPAKLLIIDSQKGYPYAPVREAMLNKLAQHGFQVGKNLQLEMHSIGNDLEQGKQTLSQALENSPDVIFITGTVMGKAAKEVLYGNGQYPVVFAAITDPVGMGLIEKFNQAPPANFTGVSYPVSVESRLRFVCNLMPQVKTIGMIEGDMPQSHSYHQWLDEELRTNPEFQHLKIIYRRVPFISGTDGTGKMAESARGFVKELDPLVDVFLSPNDQMGVNPEFAKMLTSVASKPLIGLGLPDVMENWGAFASIYPLEQGAGNQAGEMVARLLKGESIQHIYPEQPRSNGLSFNLPIANKFGIKIPLEMLELADEVLAK